MAGTPTTILHALRQLTADAAASRLTDRQLLERFASDREESAFTALVRRHGPMVLGVCRRVLHNVHDAEDVLQATFLTLARKAPARRWQDSIAGWLYLVAYRLALKVRQDRERRAARERQAPVRLAIDPLAEVSGRELCAVLDEELSRLPERYRAPLLLCCLEGLSRDEAAQRLGWSSGSVRGRLERGRELLRQRLGRRGIVLSAGFIGLALTESPRSALSAQVVAETVGAALRIAAGEAAGVSTQALALSESALRGMGIAKIKVVSAGILLVAALGVGFGMELRGPAAPEEKPAPPRLPVAAAQVDEPQSSGKDRLGDPLPAGVRSRLGTVRFRHTSTINSVAFSPDSKIIASGSLDNTLRLWDATTGKEMARFGEPNRLRFVAQVFCVAFSPDGKTVASGGNDRKLHLWNRLTGQGLHRDATRYGVIQALAFAPDGKTIASAHWDKQVVVWNTETGEEVRRLEGHQHNVMAVAYSADGQFLASGSVDKTVRLWVAATGKEVQKIESDQPLRGLALSPDGKLVAACGRGKVVHLWNTATGEEVRRLPMPEEWTFSVSFSPDGKTLAAAPSNYTDPYAPRGRVLLFDVASGKVLRQLTEGDRHPTEAVAFSPDGKHVAAADAIACTLRLWDVKGKEILPASGHQAPIMTAAFTADTQKAVTSGGDDTTRVWNAATGEQLRRLPGHFAHLLRDRKTLLTTTGWTEQTVHVWDLTTYKETHSFALPPSATEQAVDPDGTTLAVADADHVIRLLDLATGKERGRLTGHRARVNHLTFSADGKWLASACNEERNVRLWDMAARKEARVFQAQNVYSLAFSPNGALLAAGGDDDGVYVWETLTGREQLRLRTDEKLAFWTRACSVYFSPDGRMLATGGMHSQVDLWEVATGKQRRRFDNDQGWVGAFAFSRDSRFFLTGGSDTTALVWDLHAAEGGPPRLSPATLQTLWSNLADEDAARAYRAIRSLAAAPTQSVPFLRTVLKPAPRGDGGRIARLVTDLDSDDFPTREQAAKELDKLGEAVVPALRRALAAKPPLEMRRRCESLLDKWDPSTLSGDRLRIVRAVEALEHAGTNDAYELLRRLAAGGEGALVTREAQAALGRLGQK